jgi:hypothetical protein
MTEYVATRWYRAPEVMLCMSAPLPSFTQLDLGERKFTSVLTDRSVSGIHQGDRYMERRLYTGGDE